MFSAPTSKNTVESILHELGKTVSELIQAASDKGLEISEFFDVNAKTGNSTDQRFSLCSVELDLDYVHNGHFGASSALVGTVRQFVQCRFRHAG